MSKYAVYYNTKMRTGFDTPTTWDRRQFVFMGDIEARTLDSVFHILNQDEGPLTTQERQDFIREKQVHTSMSVGDVAVDEAGEAWVCASLGWERVSEVREGV